MTKHNLTVVQRLDLYIEVKGVEECWPWIGATNGKGYGKIRAGKDLLLAHRLAYYRNHKEASYGPPVLHRCNNSICCNPLHLMKGSKYENNVHAVATGVHNATGGPIPGVSYRYTRELWQARSSLAGKRTTLYEGKDFFEACCRRKSWEAYQFLRNSPG